MKTKNFFKLTIAVAVSELAGAVGAIFTTSAISNWYVNLIKPELNPPNWIFAPVWTTLYALMGISLYLVWKNNWKKNALIIFGVQLFLNALWSFIFFGLKLPGVAFFEILALWLAILYTIINFYRISKASAYLLLPYIFWVSFAAYLNYFIWIFN